jgi:hypothetical protein
MRVRPTRRVTEFVVEQLERAPAGKQRLKYSNDTLYSALVLALYVEGPWSDNSVREVLSQIGADKSTPGHAEAGRFADRLAKLLDA